MWASCLYVCLYRTSAETNVHGDSLPSVCQAWAWLHRRKWERAEESSVGDVGEDVKNMSVNG